MGWNLRSGSSGEGSYDVAEICLNGHVNSASYEDFPVFRAAHCPKCGERTVHECQACSASIRGYYRGSMNLDYHPPAFCYACGKPFPWTERVITAAKDLAIESLISDDDLGTFGASFEQLMHDSPATQVAVVRMKKIMGKLGSRFSEALWAVASGLIVEAAKKQLWPDK